MHFAEGQVQSACISNPKAGVCLKASATLPMAVSPIIRNFEAQRAAEQRFALISEFGRPITPERWQNTLTACSAETDS